MLCIKECIIVEGVYDKIKLSRLVDTTIFVTHGFSIFNNKEEMDTIKKFAKKCGIIIFTDSDAAGFKIRNFIKQSIPKENVKHAYIPEIPGKERRKVKAGKEGILGVEGVSDAMILEALKNAEYTEQTTEKQKITKTDFFNLKLTGHSESSTKRKILCEHLHLPTKISTNMLIDSINSLMTHSEFFELIKNIENSKHE